LEQIVLHGETSYVTLISCFSWATKYGSKIRCI